MLRIAVCEDDLIQRRIVLNLLGRFKEAHPEIELSACEFSSASELLKAIKAKEHFQIFLLDILMPKMNGVELAAKIRMNDEDVPIVFFTSTADYAMNAFNIFASAYILKPIDEEVFFRVMEKTIDSLNLEEEFMLLSTPGGKVRIAFSTIVLIETFERSVKVHLKSGEILISRKLRLPFSKVVGNILKDERFLHPHTSFVLNMEMVEKLTSSMFILKGGMQVPVPRYKFHEAKTRYLQHIKKNGVSILGGSCS
ncbi:MAG: LytTR family DNA-binding domain-containing protein [Oscillospiraceae bacterium]|nr:LytTR family DNA-binding domain-containing protein [Oscillospiraceae bacterium]